jgi:peptide/nickel transport system permease protein
MLRAILSRLGMALFTIWAIITLTFVIFNLLPEDPARVIAGPQARPADVEKIRVQFGLDRPALERYFTYLGNLACLDPDTVGSGFPLTCNFEPRAREGETPAQHAAMALKLRETKHRNAVKIGPVFFDLGESYLRREPVLSVLAEKLPKSLLLGGLALMIQTFLGTLIGVIAAYRKNTKLDWALVTAALIGISAPTFITGILLQQVFGPTRLGWFPIDGYGEGAAEHLYHAVLPAVTLGLYGTAAYTRLVRDEMIGLLRQDYIRTARAKGLSERAVMVRHALRNALMPLVTILGIDAGLMVSGAIVTEQVFSWPGIGRLSVEAIRDLDGPVIMGVVLLFSTFVVLANLLVDLSYAALDPRARHAA